MKHLLFLLMFVNLLIGGGAALYLHFLFKWYRYDFLRHLALYTVFMNIGILEFLVFQYIQLNIPESWLSTASPLLGEIAFLIGYLLMSGMLFCLLLVARDLLSLPRIPHLGIWLFGWCGLIILMQGAKNILPIGFAQRIAAFMVDDVIDSSTLFEVVILAILLIRSRRAPSPEMGRLARAFGLLYLSRYLAVLVLIALLRIPRAIWLCLAGAAFIYANLVPLIWIRLFFIRFVSSGFKAQDHRLKLESLVEKFAISKRELEILQLMLEGRNNKEIEQQLFISYHTVKNHVSSLYRKLGVKNRYQLLHLLTREQM